MFDGLPEEWRCFKLGQIASSFSGGTPSRSIPEYFGPGIPWLKSGEIRAGRIVVTSETITEQAISASAARVAKRGTPVVAMYGATAGVAGILDIDAAINQAVLAVVPDESKLDAEFCYRMLDSQLPRLLELTQGSGQPNLSKGLVESLDILLPPLDEQRRIAEVLRSVDEALAAQVEVCRHLESTFSCLAEASFVQPHGQRSGAWAVLPMGEICESIQVGIVVRPASYYVSIGGIPALRSLNIGENYLNLGDLVYISEEGHRLNAKSSLRAGDIVTRRTGEPGKTAMIPASFPNGLNCIDIIFSRPKAIVRAEFVSFFMNSDAAKKQVIALQGGLAQQHLNVTELKTLKVPVPPLDVQDEIITALRAAMANLERERALIDQWSRLQAALMSDLLSGRVRVPV